MFTKLVDAQALTTAGGVWSTRQVFELKGRLFVKIGAGYVPISKESGSLMAKAGKKVHLIKDVTGVDNLAVRFDGLEVRQSAEVSHTVYLKQSTYDNLRKRADDATRQMRGERKLRDTLINKIHNKYYQSGLALRRKIDSTFGVESEFAQLFNDLMASNKYRGEDETG